MTSLVFSFPEPSKKPLADTSIDNDAETQAIWGQIDHLRPNNPKDYELFLNLVEFCKVILPGGSPEHGHQGELLM